MAHAYLGFGSNIEPRSDYIRHALESIRPYVTDIVVSRFYENPAIDCSGGLFLNGAIGFTTLLTPHTLLATLQRIERSLGRHAGGRSMARTIDLDILFYDDFVIEDNFLEIPHPRLHTRSFVLDPLYEIAPNLIHPSLNKSIAELYHVLHHGKTTYS